MPHRASLLAVLLAAVGLAACGGGSSSSSSSTTTGNGVASQSAQGIFQATKTATEHASSARIFGTVHDNNQAINLDVHSNNGGNGQGTLAVQGAAVQVRKIGDTIYVLGDRTFYEKNVSPEAANVLAGKWLQTSTADPNFGQASKLFDLTQLLTGAFNSVTDINGLTKGGTSTVRGQPVVEVKDTQGNTLSVATTGPAYLLKVASSAGADNLDLADFNQPVNVLPPPNPIAVPPGSGA